MAKLDSADLKAMKDLMEVTIDEAIENKGLATNDHIGNLPTKDEYYGTMDKVMGELKAIWEIECSGVLAKRWRTVSRLVSLRLAEKESNVG